MKNPTQFLICLAGIVFGAATSHAIDLKQSKVTQVVNDVQIISAANQTEKPAAVNDIFSMPDILRTGAASRAELVAQDQTVTRVGANTIFSFDPANRTLDLKQGSLLFHSPHGKGGGTIHTGSATASVLGTTLIITTTPNGGFKVLALEGEVEVKFLNGLKQKLDPGQMTFILPGANQLAPVIIFRLDELINNSLLVKGFAQTLGSMPLIKDQIDHQLKLLHNGKLTDTGLYAGDNATPSQVEVLDVNTIARVGNPLADAAGADAHINQPSLTDASIPTPPNHVFPDVRFRLPNNGYFAGQLFSGFVARNIYVNASPLAENPVLALDLSPYSHLTAFDLMAVNNFSITGQLQFNGATPGTIELIAGNQFIFAPGSSVGAVDNAVQNLMFASPATLALNNVALYNLSGPYQNLSLNSGADISIQNNSQVHVSGDLTINAAGNISVGLSRLFGNTMQLTALNGALVVDAVTLEAENHGALAATFTASKGITLNNTTVNVDAASGSVTMSSSSGSINVTDTSITAHYLTLNSGDGILLDASGQTLVASGAGATANFTAPNIITANNADFSSFTELNVKANTIVMASDTLASVSNFGTQTGQVNVNGPEVFGRLNLLNCSWLGTPITSAEQVTLSSGPGSTPGIYSYALRNN